MTSPADPNPTHDPEQNRKPDSNVDRDRLTETDRGVLARAALFFAQGAIRLASATKGAGKPKEGDTDSDAEAA